MKISINNTSKLSANTVVDIAQLLPHFANMREGRTSPVTDDVTSPVTDDVTLSDSEKSGQTHCFSIGCKLAHREGVTLPVTRPVTNKEEKKQKKKNPPCTPKKEKK